MQSGCFIFVLRAFERLWSYADYQNIGVCRGLGQIITFLSTDTYLEMTFRKIGKPSKVGQGQKVLSPFLSSLWVLVSKTHFWRGYGLQTMLSHIFQIYLIFLNFLHCTKMKFSIKDFFSKCDQIRKKRRIWSYFPKKSLMENFIFCAVLR